MNALHFWLAYLLPIGAGLGTIWSVYRWLHNTEFSAQDAQVSIGFIVGMYLQVGIGVLLFLLSPRYVPNPLHPLIGAGALALAHWGHGHNEMPPRQRHIRRAWTYLGAGALLGLILATV